MIEPVWIKRKALEELHGSSLQQFGGPAGLRDENLFESALARPASLYEYTENGDIALLAASYTFGLAKHHAFIDDNKRVAFLAMTLSLVLNGYALNAKPIDSITNFFSRAAGDLSEDELAACIRDHMVERG